MLLHSQRLLVRNFKDSDIESFVAYRNIPEVAKYQGWKIPYTGEEAGRLFHEMKDMEAPKQGRWLQLAIELRDTGGMIGDLGVRVRSEDARQAAIGFTIAPAYWRRGFAVESVACLLDFLFGDLDLHRVAADCDVDNIGSWRTLEKLGFRREAHFIESYLVGAIYTSEYYYGLLQREWQAGKG